MAFADTKNGWYKIKVKEVSEMSSKERYDVAFKKDIAQVYLNGQRIAPSSADELRLPVNTIYKWATQYKADPDNALSGSGNMKPNDADLI